MTAADFTVRNPDDLNQTTTLECPYGPCGWATRIYDDTSLTELLAAADAHLGKAHGSS